MTKTRGAVLTQTVDTRELVAAIRPAGDGHEIMIWWDPSEGYIVKQQTVDKDYAFIVESFHEALSYAATLSERL